MYIECVFGVNNILLLVRKMCGTNEMFWIVAIIKRRMFEFTPFSLQMILINCMFMKYDLKLWKLYKLVLQSTIHTAHLHNTSNKTMTNTLLHRSSSNRMNNLLKWFWKRWTSNCSSVKKSNLSYPVVPNVAFV